MLANDTSGVKEFIEMEILPELIRSHKLNTLDNWKEKINKKGG